jgi:hypothetical protein
LGGLGSSPGACGFVPRANACARPCLAVKPCLAVNPCLTGGAAALAAIADGTAAAASAAAANDVPTAIAAARPCRPRLGLALLERARAKTSDITNATFSELRVIRANQDSGTVPRLGDRSHLIRRHE